VAALAGEAGVELDAEVDELRDPLGRLAREQVDRALPAQPAPGDEGVRRVERGVVVRADRGGPAALRQLLEESTAPFARTATDAPASAAVSAAVRPATPAPTIATS
jgi:hypothetical protein